MSRGKLYEDLAGMIAVIGEGARVAWLVGPEGVGKSALARRSSNTSGLPVIRVDVYPEDRKAPLSTAGELAANLGVSLGEDPAQDLLRALESLGPAVIIIEDAQWMDQASQVAIWQVVRRFRRLPICLIVTSTHATGTLLDGLGLLLRSPERGQVLKVEPMAVGETAALLKAELGVPIEGETLDLVQAVTGGYATLLDSLVTQVRLGGPDVTVRSALQSLTNSDQGGALLRQHVVGALGTLPAGARGALLALAQSGQLTTPQLTHLLRLRGLPDTDTGSLLATGLVERAPADALRLRHRLAARVIRDAVPWSEARLSHAALAGTLTGLEGLEHRVAAIDAAEVPEVAAELHGQLVGAYIANDLTLALRVARHASRLDPAMKIEVVLAALRSGRPSRLMDVADVVATMAASPARTAALTILDLRGTGLRAAVDRLLGIDAGMVEDHRDLVVIAHAAIQVALQATLGAIPEAIGGFAAFVDPLRLRAATLEAAEPHSAVELRMNAASLELLLVLLDDTVPAHLRIEPLQILAERMQDDPPVAALLLPLLPALTGILRYATGDLAAARADLAQVAAYQLPAVRAQAELAIAHICFLDGAWDVAHAHADRQLASALDSLQSPAWAQAFAVAALVPAVRGEAETVGKYLGWQAASSDPHNVGDAMGCVALAWADIAAGGDPARTAELLDRAWPNVSYLSCFPTGVLRVRAHLAAGNAAEAAVARADLEVAPYEAQAHAYALAHAEALLTDGDERRGWFVTAARHLRAQARSNEGASLKVYGFVLAEDWASAVITDDAPPPLELTALLDDAIDALNTNGAAAWRDRLSALARRMRPSTPSGDPTSVLGRMAKLTTREREVALLAAKGLSNREIATHLFVTVRTAEYHVHNALTKLGMTSRTQFQDADPAA